jgi:hypothetical protein
MKPVRGCSCQVADDHVALCMDTPQSLRGAVRCVHETPVQMHSIFNGHYSFGQSNP